MENIFTKREVKCNFRSKNHLQLPNDKTANYGSENIQHLGHHLWASLPKDIKDSDTLTNFKQKMKSWKRSTCICRLFKESINGIGFFIVCSFSRKESCIVICFSFILLALISYVAILY